MQSHHSKTPGPAASDAAGHDLLPRLIAAAAEGADKPALVHKVEGRWVLRRWRTVVDDIDRLSAGLTALGLRPGSVVAFAGDVTANGLLLSAAILAAGGRLLPFDPDAGTAAVAEIAATPGLAAVVVQSRDALGPWLTAVDAGLPVAVILDHGSANGRSPDDRVVSVDGLRHRAPPRGWAQSLPRSSRLADDGAAWDAGVPTRRPRPVAAVCGSVPPTSAERPAHCSCGSATGRGRGCGLGWEVSPLRPSRGGDALRPRPGRRGGCRPRPRRRLRPDPRPLRPRLKGRRRGRPRPQKGLSGK